MFRQVVAYRWKEGVTDEQKDAFRASFAGLREIPEVTSARFADDARIFEGNFDVVAVMDFPDFPAARRYVADERHQAYIREFASQMIGERVVVQHEWAVGELVGVHRVAVPVADVTRSRDWYALALGLVAVAEDDDGAEATMVHPSQPIELVLRRDPQRAQALVGFNAITLAVGTVDDLDAVVARLDERHVAHSEPTRSATAVHVDVADPDGIVVRISTLLP